MNGARAGFDGGAQRGLVFRPKLAGLADVLENFGMLHGQMVKQRVLKGGNALDGDVHEHVVHNGVENADLQGDVQRGAAVLLEHLHDALALSQARLRVGIEVRAELCEGLQLAVLRVRQLQGTGDLLHGLDLGAAADT